MKTIKELCDLVRETSYAIHLYHGHGHLEKVYENALVHRLRKAGVEVQQQHPMTVLDEDGTVLGYLKSAKVEDGLLINFGSYRFQIKKYAMSQATPIAPGFSAFSLRSLRSFAANFHEGI